MQTNVDNVQLHQLPRRWQESCTTKRIYMKLSSKRVQEQAHIFICVQVIYILRSCGAGDLIVGRGFRNNFWEICPWQPEGNARCFYLPIFPRRFCRHEN